jgi:hypothetical protein
MGITAGGDQTSPVSKGAAKGRLFSHALSPGVDRPVEQAGLLGPTGNKPPAKPPPYPPMLLLYDGENRLGGRDIIARQKFIG